MTRDEKLLSKVLDMFRVCRVKEHTPGRVVLKVSALDLPRLAVSMGGIDNVEGQIGRIPGIKQYEPSIGWSGASVAVTYDPSVFPYELWQDLCSLRDYPELEFSVIERVRALVESAETPSF